MVVRFGQTKLEKEWKIACSTIQRKDKALAQIAAQFEDFRALHSECKVSGGPPEPTPPEITPEAQEQIDHLKVRDSERERGEGYSIERSNKLSYDVLL